jgi:hypothetical protein
MYGGGGDTKIPFSVVAAVEAPYFCDGSIGFVLLGTWSLGSVVKNTDRCQLILFAVP